MKTKIIMMTALLALLATGCGKDKFNGFRIVAENMQAASDSKLLMNPNTMYTEWLAGEKIKINNGSAYEIEGDASSGYTIGSGATQPADEGGYYYAIYPGADFDGNVVAIDYTNGITAPVITLNALTIDLLSDGTQHVAFPMGAKVQENGSTMQFSHLTAAFRLTLKANTAAATLKQLKVYVYSTDAAAVPVADAVDGVSYTVKWNNEGATPNLPIGPVGEITDQDIRYGSEMVFNLKTNGSSEGMLFAAGDSKTFCIPVTVNNVKRISVVGYNGTELVFAKTSDLSANPVGVVRNTVYPVATININ